MPHIFGSLRIKHAHTGEALAAHGVKRTDPINGEKGAFRIKLEGQIVWTKQTERESRLPRSPITMPRTRPFRFWRATMRPRPGALAASLGAAAFATSCVTRTKRSEAPSSSRSARATSAVRPEGPGAAPFRASWRFESTNSGRRWSWSGWKSNTSWESASYGSAGRRSGSRSSCKVSGVPGASALDVSACRAADSSPRCTIWRARWAARAARASKVVFRCVCPDATPVLPAVAAASPCFLSVLSLSLLVFLPRVMGSRRCEPELFHGRDGGDSNAASWPRVRQHQGPRRWVKFAE